MQISIVYVGNIKDSYLKAAADEYEKRIGAYSKVTQTELKEEKLPDNPSKSEIVNAMKKEGERILSSLPSKCYKIALCVEGTELSSEEFASKIEKIKDISSNIAFIIGGPYGLPDEVKKACDFRLSISKMTFTHRMARVLLLEQIYRALNISAGGQYHK